MLPRFLDYHAKYEDYGFWAVAEKNGRDFIGWFHLKPAQDDSSELELGYRLIRAAWGRGYATEGSFALVRKGFCELGARRITAIAMPSNLASIRIMEKVGMRFESEYVHETGYDVVRYALDREMYEQRAVVR